MAIKLNNHTEGYENAKQKYAEVVKNEASTPEQIETAWNEMQAELVNSLKNQITAQISIENADRSVLAARGANVLTSTEIKFFNEVVQSDGFTSDVILPETTVDRIFEDLTTDHPFLAEINLQNAGLLTRIIKSETEGAAVWGKVFGEIKGQLDATFTEENISQSKLTAFVVLPKDLEKFGPAWVEAYVRAQIKETFAVALEKAFINGAGPAKDEPIGLIRDLEAPVSPTDGHAKKAITDTLTFATPEVTVKEQKKQFLKPFIDNASLIHAKLAPKVFSINSFIYDTEGTLKPSNQLTKIVNSAKSAIKLIDNSSEIINKTEFQVIRQMEFIKDSFQDIVDWLEREYTNQSHEDVIENLKVNVNFLNQIYESLDSYIKENSK